MTDGGKGHAPAAQPDTWTDDGGWTFPWHVIFSWIV